MLGFRSKTAATESGAATSRAVEVLGETAADLAERAVLAAQAAQKAATPVLRSAAEKSAETLSQAAERAAAALADTAERLAEGQAGLAARKRLADASEAIAVAVRPKKRRRVRRFIVLGVLAGAIAALARSPLRSKVTDRIFGAPPQFEDDTPESITLPSSGDTVGDSTSYGGSYGDTASFGDSPSFSEAAMASEGEVEEGATPEGGGSNGVATGTVNKGEGATS